MSRRDGRARALIAVGSLLLALCLGACSEDQPLPADVDAVIEARCRRCHSDPPREFAPMPLVTWNDLHADSPSEPGERVFQVLARRIVDTDFPMPPLRTAEIASFDEADRGVLLGWIEAGAPPAPELP